MPFEVSVVRAFIAIELPASIQEAIERYLQQLQSELPSAIFRWIPIENIHLTLKFLGDIRLDRVDAIQQVLNQAAERTADFELVVRGLGCFPQPHKPRVIWLGVDDEGKHLMNLHQDLDTLLSGHNFEPESRRFHPHLTFGRIKKSARPDQINTFAHHLEGVKQPEIGVFKARAVHLIRSELRPQGATYSHLGTTLLGEH